MPIDTKDSEITEDSNLFCISQPEYEATLTISPGFEIHFTHNKPNWWWRMWQFILLGWRWQSVQLIKKGDKK